MTIKIGEIEKRIELKSALYSKDGKWVRWNVRQKMIKKMEIGDSFLQEKENAQKVIPASINRPIPIKRMKTSKMVTKDRWVVDE